jgi:hypothetical protein
VPADPIIPIPAALAHLTQTDPYELRDAEAPHLRREIGRNPLEADLTALVGSCPRVAPPSRRSGRNTTCTSTAPAANVPPPEVGLIDDFDVFEMPADSGLIIVNYSVAHGTSSAGAMACWRPWPPPTPPPRRRRTPHPGAGQRQARTAVVPPPGQPRMNRHSRERRDPAGGPDSNSGPPPEGLPAWPPVCGDLLLSGHVGSASVRL